MNRAEIEAHARWLEREAERQPHLGDRFRAIAAMLRDLLSLAYVEGEETWKDKLASQADELGKHIDGCVRVAADALACQKAAEARLASMAEALSSLVTSLSDQDDEGLIEHAEPMRKARAALAAREGE